MFVATIPPDPRRLVGFEQDADAVEARFADGEAARGDPLVAADGIHSAARAAMFPDEGAPEAQAAGSSRDQANRRRNKAGPGGVGL